MKREEKIKWKYKIKFQSLIKNKEDIFIGVIEGWDDHLLTTEDEARAMIEKHILMEFPDATIVDIFPIKLEKPIKKGYLRGKYSTGEI